MNYFWVLCISTLIGFGCTAVSKIVQIKSGNRGVDITTSLVVIIVCGLCGAVFLYFFNGAGKPEILPFTLVMATLSTVLCNVTTPLTFRALELADISALKLVTTVGCLLIPFFFGIFYLKEAVTVLKITGVLLLIAALAVPIIVERRSKTVILEKGRQFEFYICCLFICIFSSASGIVNKMYWVIEDYGHNNAMEYSLVSYLMGAVVAAVILGGVCIHRKSGIKLPEKIPKPVFFAIYAVESLFGAISNYLSIMCVAALPASVMNPLSTGMSLIATTLLAWIIFREKPTRVRLISIIIAIVAIILINQ